MKLFSLLKVIPFLSTLCIIFIVNISNQKEYTKLRILIWNTPRLSLGTYLTITTGSGFLLSYILSNSLVKGNKLESKQEIKYKFKHQADTPLINQETNYQNSYDNTLIERDIKDPSPTMNASFRVIGKTNINKSQQINNKEIDYIISDLSDESYYQTNKPDVNYSNRDNKSSYNDWNDESYLSW